VRKSGDIPTAAIVSVPSWMWGGDPVRFFAEAKMHSRRLGGPSPDRWRVQTEERYRSIHPSLITVDHLIGPAVARRSRFDLLATAAQSSLVPADADGLLVRALAERQRRAEKTRALIDFFSVGLLQTTTALPAQVAGVAEEMHRALTETPAEKRPDHKPFADAGVHLVRRAPEVLHRAKLASVLLRVQHDPQLATGDFGHLRADPDGHVFAASQNLNDGIYVFDAYLGPLLGSLTPFVWAFSAQRSFGLIVYSLGQPLVGTWGDPVEPLQLLPGQGAGESVKRPTLPSDAPAQALDWWAGRLNEMFGVLTDPAIFTDSGGLYHPVKHLHALLTVEQLFRRVSSIQTVHRDTHARRLLLFSVLDMLDRLTGRPVDKLCSLPFVRERFDAVAGALPPEAATILLPAAERAVAALQQMQEGFYLLRQLGTATIDVPAGDASIRSLLPHEATAEYIKVLRDATHGHGSNKRARVKLTNALLAHHDGSIPHDLALLGYLHLLDVLARPDALAKHLHRGGAI
jgi:hypothetical protein